MPKEPARANTNLPPPIPTYEWRGVHALKRIHALNERCLEVMAQLARAERERTNVEIIDRLRSLWRGMDMLACRRAARAPILLVDVHFRSEEWWRWARDARSGHRRGLLVRPCFPPRMASELMRETLMLAWSTAGVDRATAFVLLGMTPSVGSIIAELGPQDVERIAARHSGHLRPRWEDCPAFWRKLLKTACDADEDSLRDVHLHSIQLIGGALISVLDDSAAH
jgi:hypothetical protein